MNNPYSENCDQLFISKSIPKLQNIMPTSANSLQNPMKKLVNQTFSTIFKLKGFNPTTRSNS
jgi:hypothetical protein